MANLSRARKIQCQTMNNTAILTAGNAIYAQKRARKRAKIEELAFDPDSRKYDLKFV